MTARSRLRLLGVLAYVSLLATSSFVRARQQPTPSANPHDRVAATRVVDGTRLLNAPVRIAYREYAPSDASPITLVLVHGSPGHMGDFDRLGPLLGGRLRVIAPDLPGFGASTHALPDYSFRAHALYIRQLLDSFNIKRAHVLGYSMGGGVALSFADIAPDRLASLTLLSAIGVQEMELTGDYYANHLVHGAQLASLWTLLEATPHMGWLDNAMLGIPYARNFYDSDQRPLRGILRRLQQPTLIVHGTSDDLVPYEAALEHHRLIPQSELITLEGNHFELFGKAPSLAAMIADFVVRAEAGKAATRETASPDRTAAAVPLYGTPRFPLVRGIAAAVTGGWLTATAVASSPVAGALGGGLVATKRLRLLAAIRWCFLGLMAASVWAIGRRGALRLSILNALPSHSFPAVHLRGPRIRAFLAAGAVSAVWAVISVTGSAAVAWICLRLPLSGLHPYFKIALFLVTVSALLIVAPQALTHRGRRLMLSRWRRLTRWEFWPPWAFYPPLLIYIAYLAMKHRSLTLFTAANPAIVAGGFVGESKFDILRSLSGSPDYVARARLIHGTLSNPDKLEAAQAFMNEQGLGFPIVLKPDHGQRGSGVVVVRTSEMLREYLGRTAADTIIQEYVAGPEFGVFYYRLPSEAHGHIFSITEKTFPAVVGDGRHTLEELILDDDRAVCAAKLHLDRHRQQLQRIPQTGESVPLVELGSHCRGSVFLDGRQLMTPALEAQFEAISRGFDGFYFGRFDVRAHAGVEAFRSGTGFKILELNGVTSEATHIYHPGTPLMEAYRVLMKQWRLAFAIGDENRIRGDRPVSVGELFTLTHRYRQTARYHL